MTHCGKLMRGAVLVARVCAFLVLLVCNVSEFRW